jgi:excisionase family DNA binding protein
MPTETPWLSVRDVARVLRISISNVRQMIRQGRLPARRLRGSRLLRVARADVEALLEPLPPRERVMTEARRA